MALVDISSDISALQTQADALTAAVTVPAVSPTSPQATQLATVVGELIALANTASLEGGLSTYDPLAPPSYNP